MKNLGLCPGCRSHVNIYAKVCANCGRHLIPSEVRKAADEERLERHSKEPLSDFKGPQREAVESVKAYGEPAPVTLPEDAITILERRELERVPALLHVNWGETVECLLSGVIKNLSLEGCFLETEFEHLAPETIFITYQIADKDWLTLCGQVIHRITEQGVGVHFKQLSDRDKLILTDLSGDPAAPNREPHPA